MEPITTTLTSSGVKKYHLGKKPIKTSEIKSLRKNKLSENQSRMSQLTGVSQEQQSGKAFGMVKAPVDYINPKLNEEEISKFMKMKQVAANSGISLKIRNPATISPKEHDFSTDETSK
jgi:hypothetical protein